MFPIVIRSLAGDAGPLSSPNPALADRFHFWRGASGRRYACTVFTGEPIPAYERFVVLFVKSDKEKRRVMAVDVYPNWPVLPMDADEIHIHLTEDDEMLEPRPRDEDHDDRDRHEHQRRSEVRMHGDHCGGQGGDLPGGAVDHGMDLSRSDK